METYSVAFKLKKSGDLLWIDYKADSEEAARKKANEELYLIRMHFPKAKIYAGPLVQQDP